MGAIGIHHTDTSDAAWDGPANETNLKLGGSETYYKSAHAWQDADKDPKTKIAYKFIHHEVNSNGDVGAANIKGCQTGISVLNGAMGGTTIPAADRQGVYKHLAAHLHDADIEPTELKAERSGSLSGINPRELRYIAFDQFELREGEGKPTKLSGYAAVFNQEAEIMGLWREKVAPGAYKKTIQEHDIRALWNHNTDMVLGRNKSGTLSLEEDERGLKVEITPPDTQAGRDAITTIKRGDVSQMSISFQIIKQEWFNPENRREMPIRTVREAKLFDVSPVTFPAFEQTSISARSDLYLPDETIDPLEEARRLLRCAERGMPMSTEQRTVLRAAVELYQPYLLEPEQSSHHSSQPEAEPERPHSETTEPVDERHYSAEERERRLTELSETIYPRR